ncbi:hypothetical protein Val02_26900 [Virgisporangium aliadipatigenens]|uniref:Uncharacterized protein n=1 Tax=Virgisporangium aliadipatigenens TaxID=741659 RepID=A0A8J4DPS0_9ACTN|nr:hypothetical protein Val02_26900 [Virgisporangium aliadipatigenens]
MFLFALISAVIAAGVALALGQSLAVAAAWFGGTLLGIVGVGLAALTFLAGP